MKNQWFSQVNNDVEKNYNVFFFISLSIEYIESLGIQFTGACKHKSFEYD